MAHYTGNNPVNRIDPTGNHFLYYQWTYSEWLQSCVDSGWITGNTAESCAANWTGHDHAIEPTPPSPGGTTPPPGGTTPPPGGTTPPPGGTTPPPGGTTPPPGETTPPPGGTTPPPGGTTPPPGGTTPPPGGTTPPPPVTPPVQPPPPTPAEIDAASTATKQAAAGPAPETTEGVTHASYQYGNGMCSGEACFDEGTISSSSSSFNTQGVAGQSPEPSRGSGTSTWLDETVSLVSAVGVKVSDKATEAVKQATWEAADLLEKAWFGQKVHKAVQEAFKKEFGTAAQVEVVNTAGRADMVLTLPSGEKEVYELKPFSNSPVNPDWNARAKKQREGYVAAIPGATSDASSWTVPKTIDHPDDKTKEIVLVTYPTDPGMIYYYPRNKKEQPNQQPVSLPIGDVQTDSPTDGFPIYLTPLGLLGGGRGSDLRSAIESY